MKGDRRRRDNRYNKSDVFIAGITNVHVNVRGWMFDAGKLRSVGSLDAAGWPLLKLFEPKLCTVERKGQEAEAKIGVFLALRG